MGVRGGISYRQHISFKRYIRERDNYTCQICGKYGDQVDHIIPYRICKETKPENCRTLCRSCNSKCVGVSLVAHLNGHRGALMASWERKADPDGKMSRDERLAKAKELQREHLTRIAQLRKKRENVPSCEGG